MLYPLSYEGGDGQSCHGRVEARRSGGNVGVGGSCFSGYEQFDVS